MSVHTRNGTLVVKHQVLVLGDLCRPKPEAGHSKG